ncbi:MAG: low molecular weight phosphatase family protein [Dehalogenimonas sp.]
MKKVLFVCIHNSGRSQMAEEFFNVIAGGWATGESAGTGPGETVNPVVAEAMAELGFDLSHKKPRLLTPEMIAAADRVITMGCMKDEGVCPVVFTPAEDWGLPDPKGQDIAAVRKIRDEIRRQVMELVYSL